MPTDGAGERRHRRHPKPTAADEPRQGADMIIASKSRLVEEISFHVAGGSNEPTWSPGVPANDGAAAGRVAPSRFAAVHASGGRFARGALPLRLRRIIVGIDFSPISEGARRLALGLARESGALVDLVAVLDAFDEIFVRKNYRLIAAASRSEETADMADTLWAEMDDALTCRERLARAAGVRCVHSALVGAPGQELAEHALRTGADLIVLGVGDAQPGRFGWTWGGRAAEQLLHAGKWRGPVLLRRRP
jgi:nucleotide-binding universal stress UspA family protein